MGIEMLDLELLKSFVSVVDSGGFTRAGERVHRTQSTVSQQIKRLEEDVGQLLLVRNGKDVTPTEAGERLLSYARRLLSLADEARDVVTQPGHEGAVRLGIPEDFAAYRLAKLLASCSRKGAGLRLHVRADQSAALKRDLERGELDLALFKRTAGEKGGIAVWPESSLSASARARARTTSDTSRCARFRWRPRTRRVTPRSSRHIGARSPPPRRASHPTPSCGCCAASPNRRTRRTVARGRPPPRFRSSKRRWPRCRTTSPPTTT